MPTAKGGVSNGSPHLADLMSEAWRLREVLDPSIPDARYDPKVHLARRYREVMGELENVFLRTNTPWLEVNVGGKVLRFQARHKGGVWTHEIKMMTRLGGG